MVTYNIGLCVGIIDGCESVRELVSSEEEVRSNGIPVALTGCILKASKGDRARIHRKAR